jgi:hypothetical protein
MMEAQKSAETLLQEKLGINAQIKSLNDQSNELFSMINFKESSEWTAEQLQGLDQKQISLNSLFVSLEEGFKKHYASEDSFLRLYLGPYMLEAITKEVSTMMGQLHRVKIMFANIDVKGASREDSLVKSLSIKQAMENLRQQVEAHNQKVDSVLKLLKSVIGTEASQV